MKISKITVITERGGTDYLYFQTDLAPSLWPFTNPPALKMEVAKGKGEAYAKVNFPKVPLEVIEMRNR